MVSEPPRLYTPKEVANLLRVSVPTVRRWTVAGKLPYLKIEGSVRFRATDVQKFIDRGEVK